jgi:hypothetical protein
MDTGAGESAPTGSVGVACAWSDTSATGVVARPDREFLKGRLRALEARADALRQKRHRVDERRAARALAAEANGAAVYPAAGPAAQGPMLQVPLMDPSELPAISAAPAVDDKGDSSPLVDGDARMAQAEARFNALLSEIVGGGADEAAAPPTHGEGINERVLAATINQLLTAATEVLERQAASTAEVVLGTGECEALHAAALLGELTVGDPPCCVGRGPAAMQVRRL